MLYYFIGLCLLAVITAGAPSSAPEKEQPTVIPIISQSDEVELNGTYKYSYETGNGIKREETSYDKVNPKASARSASSSSEEGGDSDEIHVQEGSYSYTAPDGTLISVRYIADENGFRPVGDHIPKVIQQAASVSSGSSAEKTGRALNVDSDSASSSALEVRAGGASKYDSAKPQTASAAPAASETKPISENSDKKEEPKESAPTTEAASTTSATNSETTTGAPATKVTEQTTPAGEASSTLAETTQASTTPSSEPASTTEQNTSAASSEVTTSETTTTLSA